MSLIFKTFAVLKISYYLQPFKLHNPMKIRSGLLIAALFVTMIGFSSCTREYICECKISFSGKPGLPDTITQEYPLRDTKKKAQSLCEANSSKKEESGITTIEDCYLY